MPYAWKCQQRKECKAETHRWLQPQISIGGTEKLRPIDRHPLHEGTLPRSLPLRRGRVGTNVYGTCVSLCVSHLSTPASFRRSKYRKVFCRRDEKVSLEPSRKFRFGGAWRKEKKN